MGHFHEDIADTRRIVSEILEAQRKGEERLVVMHRKVCELKTGLFRANQRLSKLMTATPLPVQAKVCDSCAGCGWVEYAVGYAERCGCKS